MRLSLALLASSALALGALAACNRTPPPAPVSSGQVDKLGIVDTKVGNGAEAKPGMTVQVQYTGWLYDEHAKDKHGSKFDSTGDHGGEPFSFTLGQGQVIKGWDQGVAGMHVGGERTLLIPAELGYGARGAGGVIPPNASLVFDVKLVGVGQQ
ncbi:FKBP-type peptidyl-prolyl cis-trans isomerase [Rhodanobacter sp. Si-c]|uniref:Peptidyl-prolyl cis-trans isomerase n=1 Tax=Rhodanobacter lycopersici TaxID=3162487 RepID=A0ABV3QGG4_9GAMM